MIDEVIDMVEEDIQMENKKIKVRFTSTEELDFENALGQMIKNHDIDTKM